MLFIKCAHVKKGAYALHRGRGADDEKAIRFVRIELRPSTLSQFLNWLRKMDLGQGLEA
jgi:hypothetical protein